MVSYSDINERLGIRICREPWDSRKDGLSSFVPGGGSWTTSYGYGSTLGWGLAVSGYGVLLANPSLNNVWTSYYSPNYTGRSPGLSQNLVRALEDSNIKV